MKEDYLWDKTGEDAEIQGLENALKAFRYRESEPPAPAQKVFTLEKPKRARFFGFRFGWAGFAAAVVIVLSIFRFQSAGDKIPVSAPVAETREPQVSHDSFIEKPEPAPVVKIETAPRAAKRKFTRAFERNAPKPRPVKTIWRTSAPKEPAETLTAEEKYAYDQLMLALSITGEKLKIVKDKINGIEDRNAGIDTAK
jgi:hypothetical protein